MKKVFINISLLFASLGSVAFAQTTEPITVNNGELYVLPNTLIATQFDFENSATGVVFNDGEFQFYKNYNNNGLFTHSTNKTTGYTVFQGNSLQNISGTESSKHYDVLFNNSSTQYPFQLKSDMIIDGTGNFRNGIVNIDKANGGQMLFGNRASQMNASDKSYAEGMVEKQGNNTFTFPIGKNGYYRFASISAPQQEAESYTGEYFLEDSNSKYPHASRTGVLQEIDNKEYWIINQSTASTNSVIVSLSYDTRTTPKHFTDNPELLHVVRWDEKQKLWVDEGGIVDTNTQTVTTPINVEGFGIFTLGTVKKPLLNPGEVVIYNGVTPDGDGMNDYFIIDNINYFPNNHVSIYNRWGRKVYETQGYDTKGNVFKGIAEGVDVVGKGEKLPTGTYFYVVEYLYDRDGENQWVKKVGYLHLENND